MTDEVQESFVPLLAALQDARFNYQRDLDAAAATGDKANVDAVKSNLRRHRINLNKALTRSLAANSDKVKQLTEDSKALVKDIKTARQRQQDIVSLIQKSGKLADALGELVKELK